MNPIIGIRRENLDKKGEQRVALVPDEVHTWRQQGYEVLVQPGIHPKTGEKKRGFADQAYVEAGATLTENLEPASIIFGLKEVKIADLIPNKTYLFFSHTHKGQVKNRTLLQAMVDQEITLIDYELITQANQQRIVTAFTFYAGYAGMVDSLWTLGQRLALQGFSTPFSLIKQAKDTMGTQEALALIEEAGNRIRQQGTPSELPPFIFAFLGNGRTSQGAQKYLAPMPVEEIPLSDVPKIFASGSRKKVYQVVLDIPELYRLDDPALTPLERKEVFELYFSQPERFQTNMDTLFPYATVWMNCILWSDRFPRLLTRQQAAAWYAQHQTLQVIGDITCDPEGAIEFSRETWIDDPVFVYDPITQQAPLGMAGKGIAVMAVTNLPCEFPLDASRQFSEDIAHLIPGILEANYQADAVADSGLPPEIQRATLLWQGKFTPDFQYMQAFLPNSNA